MAEAEGVLGGAVSFAMKVPNSPIKVDNNKIFICHALSPRKIQSSCLTIS